MEKEFKERIINSIEELEKTLDIIYETENDLSYFIYENYNIRYSEEFDDALLTIKRLLEECIEYGKCYNKQ